MWTRKNYVGLVAVASLAFLVLHLVAWHWEYGDKRDIKDAFWAGLGAFVLLEWVYDYQTLLGAILAIIGAGGIVWSTMVQRKWVTEDQFAARAEVTLVVITRMRLTFQRAYNELTTDLSYSPFVPGSFEKERSRLLSALDTLDQSIAVSERLGQIAELLQFSASSMRDKVRDAEEGSERSIRTAAGIAACVGAYLAEADRLIDKGGWARHVPSKRIDLVTAALSRLGFTVEKFGPLFPTLAAMFNFDDVSASPRAGR